jgi:beta-glucosidase-like glycosyl hydrolase
MGTYTPPGAETLVAAVRDAVRSIGAIAGDALTAVLRPPPGTGPISLDTRYSFAERAADLVSRMTPGEKAGQLRTTSAPAIPRLGVQQYTYSNEGQHGINSLGANTDHGDVSGGVHATSFPTNFAASMSWDPQLMHAEGTAVSTEARGFLDKSLWGIGQNNLGPLPTNYGCLTYWAPTVNLDRDPRWGRTDEAFGEDPYLAARMAQAYVNGYQGQALDGTEVTGYLKVAATAKHYALNNVEANRTGVSSDADDRALREYYLRQFQGVIEQAHVAGLMTAYNAINGTPAVAHTYTVNQIAARTYGFAGYTTSDCGAVGTTYRRFPAGHDWAPPGWSTDHGGDNAVWTDTATGTRVSGAAGGQAYALRAGTQLNCGGDENSPARIEEAIRAGVLSEGVVDTALLRVFTVRMRTGEFDPPRRVPYTRIPKDVIESPEHQALAAKVAANSLVLLKNDGLLPADPGSLDAVVVLGDLANKVTLGSYSGSPTFHANAVQAIRAAVLRANPSASVVYDAARTSTTATGPAVLGTRTAAAIRSADLVVVFVGTDGNTAGEGGDRSLAMPGNYGSLIRQVAALGNAKTVLVIQSAGPVKIDDVQAAVPAIVFSGYNGQSQGTALADVLFGRYNPSAHLNFTWYRDDAQLPTMDNYGLTPGTTGGLGRTYQYFTGTPTYPFGHGLSYTTFAYSHVSVDRPQVSADSTVTVSFDVTNTGSTRGATVAQLYVATPFPAPGVELPRKRLVGFAKTAVLRPGQRQRLGLPVKLSDLAFWDPTVMRAIVHSGRYEFQVSRDAATVAGTATVQVVGSVTPHVRYVTVQPEQVVLTVGDTVDLTGRNRWLEDDTDPAREHRNLSVTADRVVMAVNDDQSFVDLSRVAVRYRSSDPAVLTVSGTGQATAVGDGVATLTVTVDGVDGSAVVVVRGGLVLDAPRVAEPGAVLTVTTTFHNGADQPKDRVTMALSAASGWPVTATSPATFDRVEGGRSVQTTWNVTVPAAARSGTHPLTATARYQGARRVDSTSTEVSVPYPSLVAAFGNAGISTDADPSAGDFDGGGFSFSAEALAAAGFTPGASITYTGLTFEWPTAAPGTPDNALASGQTVPLAGSGDRLGLLGAAAYGSASGVVTITFADGGTDPFPLTLADWWSGVPAPGTDIIGTFGYLNTPRGGLSQTVHLYAVSVALPPGRIPRYLTLPDVSARVAAGQPTMHIFAVATG